MPSFFDKIGSFLFGQGDQQVPIYDQKRQQLHDYMTQQAMAGPQSRGTYQRGEDWINRLLSNEPGAFEDFEAPYRQQFEQETIPGIAERFAGMGSGNQSSSAFRNALGGAGANLSANLANLRSNLQMQTLPHALNYAQAPFQNLQNLGNVALRSTSQTQQGSPGFLNPILGALGGGVAGGVGQGLGLGLGGLVQNWFKERPKYNASTGLQTQRMNNYAQDMQTGTY